MQSYLIERTVPNAQALTPTDLRDLSARSCRVLADLGPRIRWRHSYVTDHRLVCVYDAASPELIREHALRGGFPVDIIRPLHAVIDPTTSVA